MAKEFWSQSSVLVFLFTLPFHQLIVSLLNKTINFFKSMYLIS